MGCIRHSRDKATTTTPSRRRHGVSNLNSMQTVQDNFSNAPGCSGKSVAGQHVSSGGGTCAVACGDEDVLQMTSAVGSCGVARRPRSSNLSWAVRSGTCLVWWARRPCAAGHAAAPVPRAFGLAQTRNTNTSTERRFACGECPGPSRGAHTTSAIGRTWWQKGPESYLLLLAWHPLPTPNSSFHHRRPQPA